MPILAVTAFDNISRRIGLFHLGINDYVIKPIIEEELVARINSLVDNYRSVVAIQKEKHKAVQENAAKSEYLALMSHELRTPIKSIIDNLQQLQADAAEKNIVSTMLDSLTDVEHSSEHLLSLINEVLDLSKIEAGEVNIELENFTVKPVIQSAISVVKQALLERNISLHERLDENVPDVYADSTRLKQALINLLANAIKYNKQQGEIFVSMEYKKELAAVLVKVRDTGAGLSAEACQGLFKKFNRGENAGSEIEGSGLGLYISKKLLNEMDADISVKSKLGKGTEFCIQLPCVKV